jgi:hypothetical protein
MLFSLQLLIFYSADKSKAVELGYKDKSDVIIAREDKSSSISKPNVRASLLPSGHPRR